MKEFLQYIIYSGICLSIFWLVYRFLLSGITFFQFNRVYLLAGLMLSFILPAFVITYEVTLTADLAVNGSLPQTQIQNTQYGWLNVWAVALLVYIAGILLLVARNLKSYRVMYRLIKKGQKSEYAGHKVIYNQSVDSPFTIFDRIFMNTRNLSEVEKELILKHESVHIDQKHWLDLVCSECALMLQWFNPFVWLYVSSIKENHEFQADDAVLAGGISPARYQAVLINQRFQGPVFSFTNSFSLTNKSNRLSMIKKQKSKSWKRAAVLAVLPLFGLFFWASAKPHYVLDLSNTHKAVMETDSLGNKKVEVKIVGYQGSRPLAFNLDENVAKTEIATTKPDASDKWKEEVHPLLVVDGEIMDFDKMNTIPTNEIESVEVFKDKTATDLYGEQGKNGVVKVTTKKK